MEPLADALVLRGHSLRFRVFYVVYCQIKLIIMLLYFATGLRASVSQYSQHRQALRRIKRQYTSSVVSHRNRCFGDVKLTMNHFRVRINERLLINTPDTVQVAYTERVLRTQISRMSRFDFATGLVITGFTLQCCDLAVS